MRRKWVVAGGKLGAQESAAVSDFEPLIVNVALAERSYEIVIARGRLMQIADHIRTWGAQHGGWPTGRKAAVITDRNVQPHAEAVQSSLALDDWTTELIVIEPGEQSKRLEVIAQMYDRLVAMRADRRTLVVAVGGGVIGDAAGFAAATYARGLPFVQVPTTLLADVDSSVGGKVGINHPHAKNLIGAFHQPLGVYIDTDVLATLPVREYRSGLAEVVKYGVILDADFFDYMEVHVKGLNERDPEVLTHAIARSCRLKADVVEQDEYERTGLRAMLNYGHTFAHAYEALAGYGELLHGEAVAIGMVDASRLAEVRGLIDHSVTQRQVALLTALGLPTTRPETSHWAATDILDRMRLDKKTLGGTLRFILPTRLGHVALFADVPESDVRGVLS
ncbi:MAG: 3-dehydroquinate synthase [Planctomycetaceae bacterium]|nr:3-dehydroquinate synthase [Planctomycetaceae bacterium]